MRKIYIDECGYTGEDLLNASQRVFVLCSHGLTEAYCAELKARHFSKVKAHELKHSVLYKRPNQQNMVLDALAEILREHRADIKLSVAHKQFALLMKIVDLVIETSMRKQGYDLYARGGHVAMSNVMFSCFALDTQYLENLLRYFQRMMRERTKDSCDEFVVFLKDKHRLDPIDRFRKTILAAFLDVGAEAVFECGTNALDLSLALAHQLVANWRTELGTSGFELVHDESSNMAKQKQLWDALVSPNARPARVGAGRRVVEYPLCVKHTAFSRSLDSAALQIADIIAGANAYLFSAVVTENSDDYATKLEELFSLMLPEANIWPSRDISPWPITAHGVEHPLSYTAELMGKLADS